MADVQGSYDAKIGIGYDGQVASSSPCTIDSYQVTPTAGIPFGRAVRQGTDNDQIIAGVDGPTSGTETDVTDYLGLTVLDHSLLAGGADATKRGRYLLGDIAAVMSRGEMLVKVEAAVTVGAIVSVNPTTGQLSAKAGSTTNGSEQYVIPGARWMTAAATDALAIVRLTGYIS